MSIVTTPVCRYISPLMEFFRTTLDVIVDTVWYVQYSHIIFKQFLIENYIN
jgi:hypothetical protein